MAENRRKSENIRRANRVIQTRTFVLMLVLGVAVFLVLALKLYQLQIKQHDYYQSKALDQQTRSTVVTASRGTIYDRNGNELAVSATAETVFLSPKELAEELEKPETKWTKESLSAGLSQLLGVTQESILEQMERTYSQYEVVKLRVDEDTANAVRELLNDNEVHGVYLETDAKRYYPYGSLAAHVIGFVGTDNTGLYGLEAQYEEELQGQTGLVVSAKDNGGNALPYEYEQYYASHNGDDLVLTLDTNVQYYLEKYVKEMADQFEAANGATGIVMDVKTGGVLGMVSYPNYDLNNYSEVSDARLKAAIEDGSASLADQQLRQWRNKALNDTYEPGSTFKILTLSAALEEGVVDMSSTFECSGSITVMGQTIHCSNTSGHGHQTLKEATGNSCNPAFINCGLGLGTDTFYEYMRSFGLLDGSGIDLAGEATGIFMAQSDFSQLDLACYAFGQNFNVTPISLIAAQAACINGGYLYQPHVVEQVRDSSGAVVYQHDNTPLRQVVSQQTSATARECLEYVVSDGGGRNGQVKGYRIGGKTGTADKGKTGDVVVSFVAFAPADDPQIIMLIAMDSPARDTGTYPSGGAMVAPVASKIMAEILPYLGIEPTYTAEELMGADTTVPYVVGMTREEAQQRVKDRGFGCQIVGDGDTITDQTPAGGAIIPGNATVILYAGAEKATELCTVPNLLGRTASEANSLASNAGLILRFTGATNSTSGSIVVLNQDVEAGAQRYQPQRLSQNRAERKSFRGSQGAAGGTYLRRRAAGAGGHRCLLRFTEDTPRRRVRSHSRLPGGWPLPHRRGQGTRGRVRPEPGAGAGAAMGRRAGPPPCAGGGQRTPLPPSGPGAGGGGRHRHQRQNHHHLSGAPHPPTDAGGAGGPDRHHPEPDRRDGAGDGAHHPGVLRRLPPAAADG